MIIEKKKSIKKLNLLVKLVTTAPEQAAITLFFSETCLPLTLLLIPLLFNDRSLLFSLIESELDDDIISIDSEIEVFNNDILNLKPPNQTLIEQN